MSDPKQLGRNDPCHCGSGKKYKQCHLGQDEAAARESRQKAQAEAQAAPAPEPENATRPAPNQPPRHGGAQPWKRGAQNTRGFAKVSATRKVGSG